MHLPCSIREFNRESRIFLATWNSPSCKILSGHPNVEFPMPGRFTQFAIRSLDQLALLLRLSPGAKLPAHLQTGRRGEEEAYFHLRELGYQMVARNYRSPRRRGDLDLIGWEKETLCFIEVKTRTTREVKPAEAAVDGDKREQLKAMAREYLRSFDKVPAFRFDLVTIYFLGQKPEITLFKNFLGMP